LNWRDEGLLLLVKPGLYAGVHRENYARSCSPETRLP